MSLGQNHSSTGYAQVGADAPLLGYPTEASVSKKARLANYFIGFCTLLFVLGTLVSSFIYHKSSSVGLNIFFIVCILLSCLSNLTLIIWYRQQTVPSRLRLLIYFNSLNTILFCICANLYHHGY